jgi:trimethylamine:corrinoid methyltransferase-like protein
VVDILKRHESMPIPAEVETRLKAIVAQAEERHGAQTPRGDGR